MCVEVKPSVVVFVAIMAIGSGARLGWSWGIAASVLITFCVLLHEVAHAAVARWNDVAVTRIGIGLGGGFTVRNDSGRWPTEFAVTAAGPLINLLLFSFFQLLATPVTSWIALCNLVLALANLVPFGPTDGARLRKTLAMMLRVRRASASGHSMPPPAPNVQGYPQRLAR